MHLVCGPRLILAPPIIYRILSHPHFGRQLWPHNYVPDLYLPPRCLTPEKTKRTPWRDPDQPFPHEYKRRCHLSPTNNHVPSLVSVNLCIHVDVPPSGGKLTQARHPHAPRTYVLPRLRNNRVGSTCSIKKDNLRVDVFECIIKHPKTLIALLLNQK